MIAIIDYDSGNLRSVQKAFEKMGEKTYITQNKSDLEKADRIVLPGVGAMKPAMEKLQSLNLIGAIEKAITEGKPFLGICLGLQLLFEKGDESGGVEGLGIIKGRVVRFNHDLKIPHMGWNNLNIKKSECPLYDGVENNSYAYFCHSFYVEPQDTEISATITDYGNDFTSSIWHQNLYGVQFHPEKSQELGLAIIKNFIERG